ncbi:MAG: methyltransferase domain-containing protein [Vicinamibacterales bacterium]
MMPFRTKSNPHMLIIGMTSVKMGDRLVQVGCSDGASLAAVAAKVGLSGKAVAVVPDIDAQVRVRRGAERAGVLVESEIGPPDKLPLDDSEYDLVIIDDQLGQFATLDNDMQRAAVREAVRVLQPGGRVLAISGSPAASGLSALLRRGSTAPVFDTMPALEAGGCRFVRVLGEREGLRFVEGIKARTSP